jgi:nucleoside-diphosphate-sugar epimerase
MKILVTGSKGFFGSIIYKHFESKYILFGLSRSGSTFDIDLQNKIPVFTEIFEIVIHAAGKAHSYPNNLLETKYYFDINLGGTKNLLLGLEK